MIHLSLQENLTFQKLIKQKIKLNHSHLLIELPQLNTSQQCIQLMLELSCHMENKIDYFAIKIPHVHFSLNSQNITSKYDLYLFSNELNIYAVDVQNDNCVFFIENTS